MIMPNFVGHLVYEKEKKLIDSMKTNGMKMRNYWAVNCVFMYIVYWITLIIALLAGRYLFCFYSFRNTYMPLMIEVLSIYGLSQISLAIFYSALFNTSQAAVLICYAITIVALLVTINLSVIVF